MRHESAPLPPLAARGGAGRGTIVAEAATQPIDAFGHNDTLTDTGEALAVEVRATTRGRTTETTDAKKESRPETNRQSRALAKNNTG